MPRVNRDLQRRMAARRERERRRPASPRRYNFATPEEASKSLEQAGDTVPTSVITVVPRSSVRTSAPVPFSQYKAEYSYVLTDLRRVGLVIGSLFLILILLYFVLPR